MRVRALLPAALLLALLVTPPAHASALKWTLRFSDDFTGTKIGADWALYGWGGPNPPKCWDPANVVVSGGQVDLKVKKITGCSGFSAAGMCLCPLSIQTYGKYEVRMKAEAGASKITFLLWGANDWPPEIDFAEFPSTGDGADRQHYTQTLHYGSNNTQIHSSNDADMTVWHTVGLEWSPGVINYTLDGAVTDSVTSHVPSVPMWLGLQTSATKAPTSTIDTWIDWVHLYTYSA
jgi:beta-glucanase (GH16 family)